MMVYLYNIFQKERNKIMTLKEIGNYILKTLETENESLNLENNIFKLEKIKKKSILAEQD